MLADIAARAGDRPKATSLVDAVLKQRPEHADALVARAGLLSGDGRLPEALDAAQRAVKADPNSVRSQLALGRIHVASQQPIEALAAFSEAARLDPGLFDPDYERARVSLSLRDYAQADQFAGGAFRKAPGNPAARILQARTKILTGDLAGAQRTLDGADEATRRLVDFQVEVGRLAFARQDRVRARSTFERVLSTDPRQAEALSILASLDVQDKRPQAALERFRLALAGDPDNTLLLVSAARVQAGLNQLSDAEKSLQRAIALSPSSLDAHALLGQLYSAQGKTEQAVSEFERVVALNPKAAGALIALGDLAAAQGKTAQAQARYEQALAADPKSGLAANNLAWTLAENGGSLDTALGLAQNAKALLPDVPAVSDTLGWIYVKKGLWSSAIPLLEDAARKQPLNAQTQLHLGLAYAKNGDAGRARVTLERALQLDAASPLAKDARAALAELGSRGKS
jgi:tetratricopeptide (TPR) repeat protein